MKRYLLLLAACWMTAASCSKDDAADKPDEGEKPTMYFKLQRVQNLAVETDDANPTVPRTEVLYNLELNKVQPASYAKTNRWDLSLSGLYNSFLSGNNGVDNSNTGYQGPGKGGITIVEKAFEEVTEIPADATFKTQKAIIGTDEQGAFGAGKGWYLYDFDGDVIGDGSYDKKHVAYAMSSALPLANGSKTTPRTIILRTAVGDYAKIKMISCYKDAFTYDKWFRTTPHMYFTFEYVVVPKGSSTFEIK